MPDESYLPDFIANFEQTAFCDFFDENIDQEVRQLVTVYHSVPKSVMMNEQYMNLFAAKFGQVSKLTHILDNPESNIPSLSKSKATLFTERIKMVCPHMFPTSSNKVEDLQKMMQEASAISSQNFKEVIESAGKFIADPIIQSK